MPFVTVMNLTAWGNVLFYILQSIASTDKSISLELYCDGKIFKAYIKWHYSHSQLRSSHGRHLAAIFPGKLKERHCCSLIRMNRDETQRQMLDINDILLIHFLISH